MSKKRRTKRQKQKANNRRNQVRQARGGKNESGVKRQELRGKSKEKREDRSSRIESREKKKSDSRIQSLESRAKKTDQNLKTNLDSQNQKPSPSLDSRILNLASNLETLLFWLLVFLIPTNMSLALSRDTAKVHGIIVDYLIPKIYLSDLVILAILSLWLIRLLPRIPHLVKKAKLPIAIPLLFATLIAASLGSINPTAAIWYVIKLAEFGLLGVWFAHNFTRADNLTRPLFLSLFFQSAIAIVQWLQKQSILGYLLLGETTLSTTAYVAKTSFRGEVRPLPYGTTAHPNILAGFIAIGLILLIIMRDDRPMSRLQIFLRNLGTLIVLIFSLIALALTQSISALLALAIGLLFLRGQKFHKQNLLSLAGLIIGLALFFLPIANPESITRRLDLLEISSQMILANPLLGVGPNNFTSTMSYYGEIAGSTRFFQPVHNIIFLWITEAGVIGTALVLLLLFETRKAWSKAIKTKFRFFIPLVMIMTIGLLDHYPLSLQTGMILSTISVGLVFGGKTE